ncbi:MULTISPECIES: SMC-Scp complex subunit ScpB [Deferrisoma]
MDREAVARVLEAVLFASPEPVALGKLVELFAPEGLGRQEVLDGLGALGEALGGRALELREVAGGYQLRTRAEYAPYLGRLEIPRPVRFSRAALETLAIVAYRQPITRAEVEEVRGVDCGGVLKALLEKGLVRVVGKKDVPGRPLLYGTSRKFLEVFGLTSLADLPSLQEIEEMLAEEVEEETGEGPAGPREPPEDA